MLHQNRRLGFI